jgi:hypothetical protein
MGVQIQKYELKIDQVNYPGLNEAQFFRIVEIERQKFLQKLFDLDSEFVALADLTPMNIACRFWMINNYHAVRQITHYDPDAKTYFVMFDATVLLNRAEEQRLPGEDRPVTQMVEVTSGVLAGNNTVN